MAAHGATEIVGAAAYASGGRLQLVELDLASLASVRAAADALVSDGRSFDVIIANAGVMATPKRHDHRRFRNAVRHQPSRPFRFHQPHCFAAEARQPAGEPVLGRPPLFRCRSGRSEFRPHAYEPFIAYGRSKTANILFAVEFDRRHKGDGIRATAVHPGVIQTELSRHMTEEATQALIAQIAARQPDFRWKAIPQGAATSVWAGLVAGADAVGGRYCLDCHVAEIDETSPHGGVWSYALDGEHAKALWGKSEEMVGERF